MTFNFVMPSILSARPIIITEPTQVISFTTVSVRNGDIHCEIGDVNLYLYRLNEFYQVNKATGELESWN